LDRRDEVTGCWRKLHYEELHDLLFARYMRNEYRQVKEDEMGRAYSKNGREEERIVGKPEGKRPLGRLKQ
jgi:hypothetical protein